MADKKSLLIIIELKEREFLSKILIAKVFSEAGWRVTIGTINSISKFAAIAPPSAILHKGILVNSAKYQAMGHVIAILDEEGGVTTPARMIPDLCKRRFRRFPDDLPDVLFAPNPIFAEELGKLPGTENIRIVVSGWPRIDTWYHNVPKTAKDDAKSLQAEHGEYLLYLSSFGAASEIELRKLYEGIDDDYLVEKEQAAERLHAFYDQVSFLQSLSQLLSQNKSLVFRPHTTESIDEWVRTIGAENNVRVIRKGDVLPWILGSKGVIVHGSTTAVQAALMGVPTMQYGVDLQSCVTDSASFSLPINISSPQEAIDLVFGDTPIAPTVDPLTKLAEEGWIDPGESATKKILRTLSSFDLPEVPEVRVPIGFRTRLAVRLFLSWLKYVAQKLGIFRGSVTRGNDRSVYGNMVGGLSVQEVQQTLRGFDDLPSASYKVTYLGAHLISVEAD